MWVIILLKRFICIFLSLLLIPIAAYGADNSATSAIVMDASSGKILYEKNAYEERSMASTTKIMTGLLAVESGRLNETVTVTKEMLDFEGSALGIKVGDTLSLYDLTLGMMLTSGNDSANAIAVFLAGDLESFSNMMNTRAKEIGMNNTFFVTPSGLDEGEHHSTAYDMALLSREAIRLSDFREMCSKASADITIDSKRITVYNHNKLLSMNKEFFGIKTGYTKKAGRCLVSAKNYYDNQIICVTLNCPDDWNDHINLIKEAEEKYSCKKLSKTIEINAVGSDKNTLSCSYAGEYYALDNLTVKEYYHPFIYAGVKQGERVGTACIYKDDILIERLPIEALEDLNYAKQQLTTTSEIYG